MRGFKPRQLEGCGESPGRRSSSRSARSTFKNGWDYLLTSRCRTSTFHCTTAYDILRHGGVKVGKADFLGAVGNS